MNAWHLELVRLWRTRRLIVLVATFLILGFGSPVLTYYLPDLIKDAGDGVEIILPEQTAADGLAAFASNLAQLGTLVVVVVAAATLAIDAQPGLAAFYRTRVRPTARLLAPRWVTVTVAAIVALLLGTAGAWYETTILLGHVPAMDLLAGFAFEAVWFCFVTGVVAMFTGFIRSVLGVTGAALGLLMGMSLVGNVSTLRSWLPTRLSGSAADVMVGTTDGLGQATIVSIAGTALALVLAVYRLQQREI